MSRLWSARCVPAWQAAMLNHRHVAQRLHHDMPQLWSETCTQYIVSHHSAEINEIEPYAGQPMRGLLGSE